MKIKSARFVTSVASAKNLIADEKMEIAFAGKSNVGKSSFINTLCGQKKLAKTSSLPGRTRLVNYFLINDEFYFVDLPGYGYAQAGQKNKEMWATLLEDYLIKSDKIKLVFMLVDLRHDPTDLDKIMLRFLYQRGLPFKIIATKADKIAKSKIPSFVQNVAKCLGVGKDDIIAFSSETGYGLDRVLSEIEGIKHLNEQMSLEEYAKQKDAEILSQIISPEHICALKSDCKNSSDSIINQLLDLKLIEKTSDCFTLTELGEKVKNLNN